MRRPLLRRLLVHLRESCPAEKLALNRNVAFIEDSRCDGSVYKVSQEDFQKLNDWFFHGSNTIDMDEEIDKVLIQSRFMESRHHLVA